MDNIARDISATLAYFKRRGMSCVDAKTGLSYSEVLPPLTAVTLKISDIRFHQPAAIFEKRHGLSGIARHYILPESVSPQDLETYALLMRHRNDISRDSFSRRMAEVACALVARNPDLGAINCDTQKDPYAHYTLIQGVASGFNPDDIAYFLACAAEGHRPYTSMVETEAYKNLCATFNAASSPGWALAPKTLARIEAQLREKSAAAPSAGKPHL